MIHDEDNEAVGGDRLGGGDWGRLAYLVHLLAACSTTSNGPSVIASEELEGERPFPNPRRLASLKHDVGAVLNVGLRQRVVLAHV